MFSPQKSLSEDLSDSKGIVKLWAAPNLLNSEWKLSGTFGKDIYHYFFVPADFVISGGKILYNFSYKYVLEPVNVYHNGIQQTEEFWHLMPDSNKDVDLQTDSKTKLPYVEVPDLGRLNFETERRYFIPLGNTY